MSDKSEKKSFLSVFAVTDRVSCEKAIRNGGIAAMFSAAVTAIFAGLGFVTSSSDKDLAYMLDPWLMVDVVLIVVLGIFVFRKSRVASTFLVLYFIASKALIYYEMGKAPGLVMSIIFLLFYVTAMRGTYIWHRSYKDAPTASVA